MNGGLDIAACELFGATVAWHVEYDAAPSKILAHHWPDVPNYGDVTTCDWESMPPVDILTGGYPCQPFSAAGQRKGTNDDRHLWPYVREAIRVLRPRYTLLENVAGHRSLGFDRVLGDLAEDGLDVRWTSLRASDVGAPHHRERLFILVTDPADAASSGRDGRARDALGQPIARVAAAGGREGVRGGTPELGRAVPADPDGVGWGEGPEQPIAGTPEEPATVGDLGTLPRDERADHLLTDRWGVPLCQTCSDALRDRVGSGSCPDPNVCGNQNEPFPPDGWPAEDWPAVPVLPTPAACNPNDGEGPETWLRRREEVKARVGNGNGMGMPLAIAVQLLPTPNASDGTGGGQHPDKRVGHSRQLIDYALEANTPAWGKYAPAIHRWEQITRPAPAPTEPNSNGKPRLAAQFAEWMMGLPAGHVTDPAIGIKRADQLKAIGNGVSPQQCYAAGLQLLAMAGDR